MNKNWESLFRERIAEMASSEDPAHDLLHFERVVATAKKLCKHEQADAEIVIPAAWLHDLVIVPKNSPLRSQASRMSAEAAEEFLHEIEYPSGKIGAICHAIEAHSFSAGIDPRSKEAAIVQDADRLDGLGAIGIARCFATAGLLKRAFYDGGDPFCESREPDDRLFTIDHFFVKLFKTAETMKTASGREEGRRRADFMRSYLQVLRNELAQDL